MHTNTHIVPFVPSFNNGSDPAGNPDPHHGRETYQAPPCDTLSVMVTLRTLLACPASEPHHHLFNETTVLGNV